MTPAYSTGIADELAARLEASLADARLSDDERRELVQALRDAAPPEDGVRQLRNRAFELARHKLAANDPQSVVSWLEGVMRALDLGRAPVTGRTVSNACFSPGEDCLGAIRGHLRQARRTVDICVFTLSDDRISQEVLAAHGRGVALRLLTDNDKEFDAGSDVARLRSAGVPVAVDHSKAHMHHKFAIIDGRWLLNGSYNWTRSACYDNEENLIVSNDPRLIEQFQGQFDTLWRNLTGPGTHSA